MSIKRQDELATDRNPQVRVRPDSYEKLVRMAGKHRRNLVDENSIIIDEAWEREQKGLK